MSDEIRIVNIAVLTVDGTYNLTPITIDEAKDMIRGKKVVSHVTYQGTATLLSSLLDVYIPVNRKPFTQEIDEKVIVFQHNFTEPHEWKVLERLS